MNKANIATFVAAILLSAVMLGNAATAMPLAAPSALGVAGFVQQATVICGNHGCAPVQTHRIQKHRPGTGVSANIR
jgi:hypothetical protein